MAEPRPRGREPSDVLREYFAKLARSIQDPDGLALELYSRKMITQSVRDNAVMVTLTKQQKSTILLQAVESKLEANPSDFTTLIAVFQSDPTLMPVAARMIQMYRGQTLEEETPQPPPLPQRKTRERPRETMKETPQPPPLPQQKTRERPRETMKETPQPPPLPQQKIRERPRETMKETPQPPPLPQQKIRERPRETMKETPQPPPLPQQKTQRPIEVRQRNIILLGKTGAGKSTITNHIIGQERFHAAHHPWTNKCRQPSREVSIVHMGPGSIQYNFKVFENIGLFDVDADDTNLRCYTSTHFPEGFNLVLFVIKGSRFTPEERDTLRFLINGSEISWPPRKNTLIGFRQEISKISALIITHCDGMDDERRKATVRDFHTSPHTKEIADFMGKGIYTVGFPNLTNIVPELMQCYKEDMKKDEETLHQLIYACDEQMPLYTHSTSVSNCSIQ